MSDQLYEIKRLTREQAQTRLWLCLVFGVVLAACGILLVQADRAIGFPMVAVGGVLGNIGLIALAVQLGVVAARDKD